MQEGGAQIQREEGLRCGGERFLDMREEVLRYRGQRGSDTEGLGVQIQRSVELINGRERGSNIGSSEGLIYEKQRGSGTEQRGAWIQRRKGLRYT